MICPVILSQVYKKIECGGGGGGDVWYARSKGGKNEKNLEMTIWGAGDDKVKGKGGCGKMYKEWRGKMEEGRNRGEGGASGSDTGGKS